MTMAGLEEAHHGIIINKWLWVAGPCLRGGFVEIGIVLYGVTFKELVRHVFVRVPSSLYHTSVLQTELLLKPTRGAHFLITAHDSQ